MTLQAQAADAAASPRRGGDAEPAAERAAEPVAEPEPEEDEDAALERLARPPADAGALQVGPDSPWADAPRSVADDASEDVPYRRSMTTC